MSAPEDVYRPPAAVTSPEQSAFSAADWRLMAKVLAGVALGGALLEGTVEGLRAGWALDHFSAAHWTAGIVAFAAVRMRGAAVAATAAAIALVVTIHRRSDGPPVVPRFAMLRPALVAVPIAALIAACVMSATSIAIASVVFDVSLGDSWRMVAMVVTLPDPVVGMAFATAFALILGVAAPAAVRWMATLRGRLPIKIVAALLVTQLFAGVLIAAVNAILLPREEAALPTIYDLPGIR